MDGESHMALTQVPCFDSHFLACWLVILCQKFLLFFIHFLPLLAFLVPFYFPFCRSLVFVQGGLEFLSEFECDNLYAFELNFERNQLLSLLALGIFCPIFLRTPVS